MPEAKKTIEILHPIEHDQVHYSRGVIELDESLADTFLSFRDTVSGIPIARLPLPKEEVKSKVTPARASAKSDGKN